MKSRKEISFLFIEKLSLERLEWLSNCFNNRETEENLYGKDSEIFNDIKGLKFFLTGDALFSLIDKRYQKHWLRMLSYDSFQYVLDSEEIKLLGLKIEKSLRSFLEKWLLNNDNNLSLKIESKSDFWDIFIKKIHAKLYGTQLGFLEFRGPYMSRTSVYALRLLKQAIENNLNSELFTYLDGIHLGHLGQKPSEFENIGKKLRHLSQKAKQNNLQFKMLSCSRCGTARGYIREKNAQGFIQSDDVIPNYLFCNLNKIIDEYEKSKLILAPSWGSIQYFEDDHKDSQFDNKHPNNKPPIIIFITHSPYGSEWTFGGLSFAMACANHSIPIKVIFTEDGTYCLSSIHKISDEDKIFNMQDIIRATSDMDYLEYYVLDKSLNIRNLDLANILNKSIEKINNIELGRILLSRQDQSINHKRIIFY